MMTAKYDRTLEAGGQRTAWRGSRDGRGVYSVRQSESRRAFQDCFASSEYGLRDTQVFFSPFFAWSKISSTYAFDWGPVLICNRFRRIATGSINLTIQHSETIVDSANHKEKENVEEIGR